jgi:hypothetical protein
MTDQNNNFVGIISVLQNGVQAINNNTKILSTIFPLATSSVSNTATAGTDTLPANPAGFLLVNVNGTAYKVPLYLP